MDETTNERAAIDLLARLLPGAPPGETWLGDDAAVLYGPGGTRLLFATDCLVEAVHFDLRWSTMADVGWKALAVNVSDIAAMGGRPIAAVVAVAGPVAGGLEQLYEGLVEAAARYGCPVVGGDLSASAELVVTIAVLGDAGEHGPVLRSGAGPGDQIFVTGSLGAAAAGMRLLALDPGGTGDLERAHRRPEARLSEGQVAAAAGATAMIDVSDGLGIDVDRLASASGIGVELDYLPVSPGATIDEALGGGEDYELVFTAPDLAAVRAAFSEAGLREPIVIGTVSDEPGLRRFRGALLPPAGFEHQLRAGAPPVVGI